MAFIEQFEFLNLLHNDIAATWLVKEKSSGRRLLLHKYPKESKLREQLLSMPPDQLIKLIAAGEDDGLYVVVTYDLPELRQFRQWVESGASELAKTAPRERPVTAAPNTGEFTRMFSASVLPNELKPTAPDTPVLRNEPNSPKVGEFTQMFQAPVLRNEPKPTAPQAPVLPNEPRAPGPGEFTQMFGTPVLPNERKSAAPQTPVLPNEPRAPDPGEFTHMFKTLVDRPRQPDGADEILAPPPNASKPANASGEFTRIFGSPLATASSGERLEALPPPSAPEVPRRPSGDFTAIFGSTDRDSAQRPNAENATGIFSQPKLSGAASTHSSEPAGPSEYTRIIRPAMETGTVPEPASQVVTPAPKQAVTPEKTAPPDSNTAKPKNLLPLVIILSLLVIEAAALVAYFMLKR